MNASEFIKINNNASKARRFQENYDSARYKGFEDGKNTDINKPIAGGVVLPLIRLSC